MTLNFAEVSNKFQVCQTLIAYLKKLGFYYDVNFNHFFYPNINQIRKILGFLLVYQSKKEEEIQMGEKGEFGGDGEEKDNFEFLLKKRIEKWIKKPWIMPEFYLETKNTFVKNRRKIRVFDHRDTDLISMTKNKKILGVHDYLQSIKVFNERINFKNESLNCIKISDSAFIKAYEHEKKDTNDFLDDGETEMEAQRNEFLKEKELAFKNLKNLIPKKVRNINEIIKDKKNSFPKIRPEVDGESEFNLFNRNVKFEQDNDFAMKMIQRIRESKKNAAQEPGALDDPLSKELEEARIKHDIELKNMEEEIVKINDEYRNLEIEEGEMDVEEEIILKKREWKKKKDLFTELETLQTQGIGGLDQEISELEGKLRDLQKQLEDYKQPIQEEILHKKEKLKDMKLEYNYKHDQIKDIKKQIKKSLAELKYKKEMLKFMEEEYSKIPKDINRNQYIKRINEIVNNVKTQQEEIQRSLSDLNLIQENTNNEIRKISKLDKEVENMLFKPAQKDKTSKKIYEEFLSLKDAFSKLIGNVQNQNLILNSTKEVNSNIEAFKGKYKNFEDYKKIEEDLIKMQNENSKLEVYISQHS